MNRERKKVLLVFIFFFLIMNMTSCAGDIKAKKKQPILLSSKEIKFVTDKAIKIDIDDKIFTDGKVESFEAQKLAFKTTGVLTSYDVYMGKEVKKGELLAAIDIEDIDHKIKVLKLKIDQDKIKIDIAKESSDNLKIKDAEMELKIDEVELDKLQEHRNNYCLISEVNGIVEMCREINLGSIANRNITLIEIMDIDQLCIKVSLNREQVNRFEIEDLVQVIVNGETYESKINDIYDTDLFIEIPDELKGNIMPLSRIAFQKIFKQIKDAILVPKTGIYTDKQGVSTVQVVEAGRIVTKEVVLGEEINEYYQILEGINEGEEILVK